MILGEKTSTPFVSTSFPGETEGRTTESARGGAANAAIPGPRPRLGFGDSL